MSLSTDAASTLPPTDALTRTVQLADISGNVLKIHVRVADGFVNATKLCQAMGKRWNSYWPTSQAKEFVAALIELEGQPSRDVVIRPDCRSQHTWIHPDLGKCVTKLKSFNVLTDAFLSVSLAVNLAQWASSWYGLAVSRLVRQSMYEAPTTKAPVNAAPNTPVNAAPNTPANADPNTPFGALIQSMTTAMQQQLDAYHNRNVELLQSRDDFVPVSSRLADLKELLANAVPGELERELDEVKRERELLHTERLDMERLRSELETEEIDLRKRKRTLRRFSEMVARGA